MASHLKVPVEELKERITFSEFLGWLEFIRLEEERNTKMIWYLAQIACEVRRTWTERGIKIKDFLIEFKTVTPDIKERMNHSKQTWANFLKVDINQN